MTYLRSVSWNLFFVLLTGICGCGLAVEGNGKRVTEKRSAEDFSAVDGNGPLDVEIRPGEDFDVELRLDSNLLEFVETRVHGKRLEITTDDVNIDTDLPGPHVIVELPVLEHAELSGSGTVRVRDFDHQKAVTLELSGSGQVIYDGTSPELTISLSGSGNVDAAGAADWGDFVLSGSGEIDASDLDVAEARLRLFGSGEIDASVFERVDIELDGSGGIDVNGNPAVRNVSQSGSGDVTVR